MRFSGEAPKAEKSLDNPMAKNRPTGRFTLNSSTASSEKNEILAEIPRVIDTLKAKEKRLEQEELKKEKLDRQTFGTFISTQQTFKRRSQADMSNLLQENAELITDLTNSKKKNRRLLERAKNLEILKTEQELRISELKNKEEAVKRALKSSNESISNGSQELKSLFSILNNTYDQSADSRKEKESRVFYSPTSVRNTWSTSYASNELALLKQKTLVAQIQRMEDEIKHITAQYAKNKEVEMSIEANLIKDEEAKLTSEIEQVKKYIASIENDNKILISHLDRRY